LRASFGRLWPRRYEVSAVDSYRFLVPSCQFNGKLLQKKGTTQGLQAVPS
jgi:hypothetical protein